MGAALLAVGIELLIGIGIGLIVTVTALRGQSWRAVFPMGF